MALQTLTHIDLSYWQKEKPYPLDIRIDSDPASADLQLENAVLSANSANLYSFTLQPGSAYRFDLSTQFAQIHGFLTLSGTNQVLWANAAGLSTISADRTPTVDLMVNTPTEVTLTVFNPTDQAGTNFNFASFTKPASGEVDDLPTLEHLATSDNVVRYAQVSTGQYFYTASLAEQAVIAGNLPDFRLDGPMFSGDDQAREGYVPVYRFFNETTHGYFFTANEQEKAAIQSTLPDFRFEGAMFFVPGQATAETIPVFRLQNLNTGAQLLTPNPVEKAYALLSGDWLDQDIAFQAFPALMPNTLLAQTEHLEVPITGIALEHSI